MTSIDNLSIAATYFTIKYEELLPEPINIRKVKTLVSQVDILPPKFRERDYEAYESGLGLLVRKQQGARYRPGEKGHEYKICVVLEKEIEKNSLGIADSYYFYVIHRSKLLNGWGRTLNLKKYFRAPGFYLPFSILKHIDVNKVKNTSELVLMVNNSDETEPILKRISSKALFDFYIKEKMPLMIDSYGSYKTAIPMSIMEDIKAV
jgi:hypothetical protein